MPSTVVLLSILSLAGPTLATDNPFSLPVGFDIQKVASLAESLPTHSWEYGTSAEALLELYHSEYSVFGVLPFPVPTLLKDGVNALSFVDEKIKIGKGTNGLCPGDGSVGDPASLGVSAVMLGKTDEKFKEAAEAQLNYLLSVAPRWENGAISHRANKAILWADFMYMAPPFVAYYVADSGNATLLYEAYLQCQQYREVLSSGGKLNTTTALWKHIVGPEGEDLGHWSTGNAWAAAGMTRVLATITKAPCAISASWRDSAVADLTSWIQEILDNVMYSSPDASNGLVRNYIDSYGTDSDAQPNWGEISGSSLLASVAYRMAVLAPGAFSSLVAGGDKYVSWADGIMSTLEGTDGEGKPHVMPDGVVRPAVNPMNWRDERTFETGSPEGQAFVTMAYAAKRDCIVSGICSISSSLSMPASPSATSAISKREGNVRAARRRGWHVKKAH